MAKKEILEDIKIEKYNEKGFGVTHHPNFPEREILVLGVIPNEIVDLEIYKRVKKIYYANLIKIKKTSPHRVPPKDSEAYLSSSPWQIIDFNYENKIKKELVKKYFREHADFNLDSEIFFPDDLDTYHYRNKTEYGFWLDKESQKWTFAFFKRGSSRDRVPITQYSLNTHKMNQAGLKFLDFINQKKPEFGTLKYLVLRYSFEEDRVIANLIIKNLDLEKLNFHQKNLEKFFQENQDIFRGIILSYSPPETPGSRIEKEFYKIGDEILKDKILDKEFYFHHTHFFQIYVPAFEFIVQDIKKELKKKNKKWNQLTDLFAGVGTFGILLNEFAEKIKGVEISPNTKKFALKNAEINGIQNFNFIEASVDEVLEEIKRSDLLVLDPPRAGLSQKSVKKILEYKPQTIVYLSCNPKTQAMDFNWLKNDYKIIFHKGYNIFPHTPHIEHLLILEKK